MSKKDLKLLISRIKAATGLKQQEIAAAINYSSAHFSTLKNSNSTDLYKLLEKHYEEELNRPSGVSDDMVNYLKKSKHINAERALIDMLTLEVAKLKSKLYGISVEDAIDELEQNASLALRQIEKGGGK
jgi:transcriptional regulator with XRE-family HTH domain